MHTHARATHMHTYIYTHVHTHTDKHAYTQTATITPQQSKIKGCEKFGTSHFLSSLSFVIAQSIVSETLQIMLQVISDHHQVF